MWLALCCVAVYLGQPPTRSTHPPRATSPQDNIEVVKRLVEAGADPTKPDKSGNTPLHAAAGEGAMAVVKYFVEKGVPAGAKNAEGFTPLVRRDLHEKCQCCVCCRRSSNGAE